MSRTKLKLYGSIVALAVVGLLVDRFVVGQPRGADASQFHAPHAGSAAQEESKGVEIHAGIAELFPTNLSTAVRNHNFRDPFLPPAEVLLPGDLQPGNQAGRSVPVQGGKGGLPTVDQFVSDHTLNGVSVVGKSAMAIVDGDLVEVGQHVSQARLLTVAGNKAYFQCLDGVATLTVDLRH